MQQPALTQPRRYWSKITRTDSGEAGWVSAAETRRGVS
jgi:hypothetical protein